MANPPTIVGYTWDKAKAILRAETGNGYSEEMECVLKAALSDTTRIPSLKLKTNPIELQEYIQKWVEAYHRGYTNRPSVKRGKPSSTHPDVIIKILLEARLPDLSSTSAEEIVKGHSVLMSLENLVGDLLEEYLSERLKPFGWYCAWGSTIDAVDFCNKKGELLQVKNSDNSENSSSSRVRSGTKINKWSRRKSSKADRFSWDTLQEMTGADNLSEEDFRTFAVSVIKTNPDCIYIADSE